MCDDEVGRGDEDVVHPLEGGSDAAVGLPRAGLGDHLTQVTHTVSVRGHRSEGQG